MLSKTSALPENADKSVASPDVASEASTDTSGRPARPGKWRQLGGAARVLARAAATAGVGVLSFVVGVYLLPQLSNTKISSAPGPAPTVQGTASVSAIPGGPLPGASFPSGFPTGNAVPTGPPQVQPGRPADALASWAGSLAHLGIPHVALQAYGYAESVLTRTQPSCHFSWTLIAGIGSVESQHGQHADARLLADGTSQPKIIGISLDGTSTDKITDTDGGKLDGDKQYDRAMGALQFIPSTWKKWAIDADNDGKADPHDLDDAALSAAYYLCAGGRDLATGNGWWSAVLSYNHITRYATKVYSESDRYGRNSTR